MDKGLEMEKLRALADARPANMTEEVHFIEMQQAGVLMRDRQAKVRALQAHAYALRREENFAVANNLADAAGAINFLVCLSQRAYDNYLGPANAFMEAAAKEAGWE